MTPLRILLWNIQNLGPTKLARTDIIAAIADIVEGQQPDLFLLLEINTTRTEVAAEVGTRIAGALQKRAPGCWSTFAISPPSHLEFYGFFVRDPTVLRPVGLLPPADGTAPPVVNDPADPTSALLAQRFATCGEGEGTAPVCRFPLILPNLPLPTIDRPPSWTGRRLPCLALFEVGNATEPYLPILVGHFAANDAQSTRQVDLLPAFDIVSGACNGVPPMALTINGQHAPISNLVVAGDFNLPFDPALYPDGLAAPAVPGWAGEALPGEAWDDAPGDVGDDPDYEPGPDFDAEGGEEKAAEEEQEGQGRAKRPYGALMGVPRMGRCVRMRAATADNTLLATPDGYRPRTMKHTRDLAVSCIDNILVSARLGVDRSCVLDVPSYVRRGIVDLEESVVHYTEQEMRGLGAGPYDPTYLQYAGQLLSGEPAAIGPAGALVGARLISDHQPVVAVLHVP